MIMVVTALYVIARENLEMFSLFTFKKMLVALAKCQQLFC